MSVTDFNASPITVAEVPMDVARSVRDLLMNQLPEDDKGDPRTHDHLATVYLQRELVHGSPRQCKIHKFQTLALSLERMRRRIAVEAGVAIEKPKRVVAMRYSDDMDGDRPTINIGYWVEVDSPIILVTN